MRQKKWMALTVLTATVFASSGCADKPANDEAVQQGAGEEQVPVESELATRTEQQIARFVDEQNWAKVILHYKNIFLSNTTTEEPTAKTVDYYNEALLAYYRELKAEDYYYYRDYETLDFERLEPEVLQSIEQWRAEHSPPEPVEELVVEELEEPSEQQLEPLQPEPSAREVYNYAQMLFDIYTNNGESYIAEIHDSLVMQEVADHYQISVEQANRLYMQGF